MTTLSITVMVVVTAVTALSITVMVVVTAVTRSLSATGVHAVTRIARLMS